MKWISIKDKLPEFDTPVFVCETGKPKSLKICRLEGVRKTKDSRFEDWLIGFTGSDSWYYDVTHWMPLPELPKPPKSTPPEHIICKGSIVLGTGCGVCSKCLQELEKQKS